MLNYNNYSVKERKTGNCGWNLHFGTGLNPEEKKDY
jgi:hypothetical protein